jgi:uncharacterized protein YndB with AHSA1/START domain
MQMYHFVTEWTLNFPIDDVWQELGDFKSLPEWWLDWKKLELRGDDTEPRVGSIFDCEVRGSLPYSLRYSLEITCLDPPRLNEHKASGDLVGDGKWVLMESDNGTMVQHHWHVGTSYAIFNLLARFQFIRDLMEKNHAEVMARGYQGLNARLEQKMRRGK